MATDWTQAVMTFLQLASEASSEDCGTAMPQDHLSKSHKLQNLVSDDRCS